jgi:Uma2 family endonuclease
MSVVAPKSKIKFTYEDYKSLPVSENKQYELLDGNIIMVPAPTTYHQRISWRIEFKLALYVEITKKGEILHAPIDVVLWDEYGCDVVQPDIIFISQDRLDIIKEEEIRGAPDLVIEILSPATEKKDRFYKKALYARHGVREYWIVDPERKTIEVYTLTDEGFNLYQEYKIGEVLRSLILEGFELDLREVFIFQNPPPMAFIK